MPLKRRKLAKLNNMLWDILTFAYYENTIRFMTGYSRTPYGLTNRDFTFENPLDLAPVNTLFGEIIEEELQHLEPDQPLVILAGEIHSHPIDIASHICNIDYLLRKHRENPKDSSRRFLFAHEGDFNAYASVAKDLSLKIPSYLRYHPEKIDPHNRVTLCGSVLFSQYLYSPETSKLIQAFLYEHSIPTLFNDVAKKDAKINEEDPLFEEALNELKKRHPGKMRRKKNHKIHPAEASGMFIRNKIMVERALQKAKETHSRIIFQRCGGMHVFGNDTDIHMRHDETCLLEDSLSTLYQEAGARVLPIITPTIEIPYQENVRAIRRFPNTFIRRGLDDTSFFYDLTNLFAGFNPMEVLYLQNLLKNYSTKPCPVDASRFTKDVPSIDELKHTLKENVAQHRKPSAFQRLFLRG